MEMRVHYYYSATVEALLVVADMTFKGISQVEYNCLLSVTKILSEPKS